MVLSTLAYFRLNDDRLDRVAEHLLERQMTDGGGVHAKAAANRAGSSSSSAASR